MKWTMIDKIRNFYFNKYVVSPFAKKRYYLSYSFKHKALWFRVYKVGTRTIDNRIKADAEGRYIYSSAVAYLPAMYESYFKFAFVRNPVDRFVSGWTDKVLNQNYYKFDEATHSQMKQLSNFIIWVKQFDLEKSDEHLMAQYALIDTNNLNFLGRFERFEEDFAFVAKQIGLGDYNLEKLNVSNKKSSDVSEIDMRAIAQLYAKDIRLFYPELISLLDS